LFNTFVVDKSRERKRPMCRTAPRDVLSGTYPNLEAR